MKETNQRRRSNTLSPSNLTRELISAVDLNASSSLDGRFNGGEKFDSWADDEHPISSCIKKKKDIIN